MDFKIYLRRLPMMLAPLLLGVAATSCLDDDDENDNNTQWRLKNETYVQHLRDSITPSGEQYFTYYAPVWSPKQYVLIHWHTRPDGWEKMLRPLDNSTVDIKYCGKTCEGTVFDSSYTNKTPADSIFRTQPSKLVVGFHAALTQMVPGDSVTIVIPADSGYGSLKTANVLPYSSLTFDVKFKSIVNYDKK